MKTRQRALEESADVEPPKKRHESKIQRRLLSSVERLLPGETIGENTRALLEGLVSVSGLTVLARGLTAGTLVLAGRWLGPAEFGTLNLVLATALLLAVPMQLGFPSAMIVLPSRVEDRGRQAVTVSTVLLLGATWSVGAFLGLMGLRELIAAWLRVTPAVYTLGSVYALANALLVVGIAALQGVRSFRDSGRVQAAHGLILFVGFACLLQLLWVDVRSFVVAAVTGMGAAAAFSLWRLRPWLVARLDLGLLGSIRGYAFAGTVQAAFSCGTLASLPLILSAFATSEAVGIFSAYRLGSVVLAQVLAVVLGGVLIPMSSGAARFHGAWRRFLRLAPLVFLAGFVGFGGLVVLVLTVAGRGYPVDTLWVLLFAGAGTVANLYWTARSLLLAHSQRGFWLGTWASGLELLVTLGVAAAGIPRFGVSAAALALLLGNGVGLCCCLVWGNRLAKAGDPVGR